MISNGSLPLSLLASRLPHSVRVYPLSAKGEDVIPDSILYWNEVALEANRVSHTNGKNEQTGPTLSSRALGIVHLAMYDAFAGISGNPLPALPAYLPGLPAPPPASADAAVAELHMLRYRTCFPAKRRSLT